MYIRSTNKALGILNILFFIFMTAQGIAQSNLDKNKEYLIGAWGMDYNKTLQDIKQSSRVYYDSLKVERKDKIQNALSQREIIFSSDGVYTLIINSEKQKTGFWELLNDNITLLIQLDGRIYTQKLESINSSKMVLDLGVFNNSSVNRLFDKWHLKKIN